VIDGEVVVLDEDSVSDFDALASRKHVKRALFYAFVMLAGNGEDLRTRKATSATIYSAWPATRVSKGLFRNASIAPMAPASAPTGSRSRTPLIRPTTGFATNCFSHPSRGANSRSG
jgi:hypothetical protein